MSLFAIRNKFIPCGKVRLPGDKSIAHRALIVSALCRGKTEIKNFPVHDDSLSTLNVLSALGARIERKEGSLSVFGAGFLKKPRKALFAGDSGTTLRLMLGVLSGLDFETRISAGKYLSLRPMARVNKPLRLMGAEITSRRSRLEEYPPMKVKGGGLKGITYIPPVASAQVKSAILLAGLYASGRTKVIERVATRDHTERMLKFFGAKIVSGKKSVTLDPSGVLSSPGSIYIPGDISSAAFLAVLAAVIPGSRVTIEAVCLNPSRCGVISALKKMGAKILVRPYSGKNALHCPEPAGDIIVSGGRLKGINISARQVPSLIDELPVLMVAACFAEGSSMIRGAGELRVKETDRIHSMSSNLSSMGASIRLSGSGRSEAIVIDGKGSLDGARLKSFGDHRTAMSALVAALGAKGNSKIDDISCIGKSFPGFLAVLDKLAGRRWKDMPGRS
ncbi:MAG: 3-phosphoshikimate 1-carboxyvinyltransferase [Candidatus Omnitrophica bacterium]|nr:3-phosphoshikimate 1-carboxyvinyltransferase [Candidatus Omnitrophota bacterium]